MDVGVRAVLSGWSEGQRQVDDFAKSLDKVKDSADDVGKASSTAGGSDGLGKFTNGAKAANDELKGLSATTVAVASLLGTALVAAAAYVGTQFLDAVQRTRQLGDELHNMSQRTGMSVEALSASALAAETAGLSLEQYSHGVEQFSRKIVDAAAGQNEASSAFRRAGIEVKDQFGTLKTGEQLMAELADRFSAMQDGAGKTALAIDLFGRAGAALIPLLNQGSAGLEALTEEARKAGVVMSSETARAANELNENLAVLKAYGQGFWNDFASPVIKGLAEMTRFMREARREGAGLFGMLAAGVGAPSAEQLEQQKAFIISDINRMEAAKAANPRRFSGVSQIQLDASYAGLQRLMHQQGILSGEGVEGPQTSLPGPAGDSAAADRRAQKDAEFISQGAERYAEMVQEDLVGASKATAEYYKNIQAKREKEEKEARKGFVETAQVMQDSFDDMIYTWDEFGNRLVVTRDQFAKMQKDAEDLARAFGGAEFSVTAAASSSSQALSSTITDVIKGHESASKIIPQIWHGIVDGVIKEISRLASKAILEPIFAPMKRFFDSVWKDITDSMKPIFEEAWSWLKEGFTELMAWLRAQDWASAFGGDGNMASSMMSMFGGSSGGGGGGGGGILGGLGALMSEGGGASVSGAAGSAIGAGEGAVAYEGIFGGAGAVGGGAAGGAAVAEGGAATGAGAGAGGAGAGVGGAAGAAAAVLALMYASSVIADKWLGFDGWMENSDNPDFMYTGIPVQGSAGSGGDWFKVPASVPRNIAAAFAREASGRLGSDGISLDDLDLLRAKYGLGGVSTLAGFASGTSGSVFTSPSMIMVGEGGPEMVSVSPLGGSARGGMGGGNIVVQGPVIMDPFTQKRFARMMGRMG